MFIAGEYPKLAGDRVATATNDAFMGLYKAACDKPEGLAHPKAFLFALAKNRAIDQVRLQSSGLKYIDYLDRSDLLIFPDTKSIAPTANAEMEDVYAAVREAIAQMPARQRQVAQLIHDHSNGEITATDIQCLLMEESEKEVTRVAANRALEEVKRKLRAVLRPYKIQLEKTPTNTWLS